MLYDRNYVNNNNTIIRISLYSRRYNDYTEQTFNAKIDQRIGPIGLVNITEYRNVSP